MNRLGINNKLGHEEEKKFVSNIIGGGGAPQPNQPHSGYKALGNQKLNLSNL